MRKILAGLAAAALVVAAVWPSDADARTGGKRGARAGFHGHGGIIQFPGGSVAFRAHAGGLRVSFVEHGPYGPRRFDHRFDFPAYAAAGGMPFWHPGFYTADCLYGCW